MRAKNAALPVRTSPDMWRPSLGRYRDRPVFQRPWWDSLTGHTLAWGTEVGPATGAEDDPGDGLAPMLRRLYDMSDTEPEERSGGVGPVDVGGGGSTRQVPTYCALCVSRCGATATITDGVFVAL